MATVYLARDLKHDRDVAFKLYRPETAFNIDVLRFRREIATAARLQHPHICTVYDSGETEGLPWFTMPYVRGESLRERLRREGRLPVEEALRITREAAQALAYAHREGVIHRDVKPENILLTEDGVSLLADFGVARCLRRHVDDGLTEAGHGIGTPAYMAPEQAMAMPADSRADQYALAATCWEMLAGARPHEGPTLHAVIAQRLSSPAPGVRTRRAEVPITTEVALQRALALQRDERFDSISDFARALTEPGVARPAGRRVPRSAWIGLSVALAAALVLLAGRDRRPVPPAEAAAIDSLPRLAVLPFENLGDSGDAYFADGMADEVRAKLAGLPGLEVIARGSSSHYRGTRLPAARIAEELGARYLLTGTVRWEKGSPSRVRVSPELVEASTGVTRWARPFDAAVTDVFAVQADIAGQVAGALHLAFSDSTRARLADVPTGSLEAYARYLRSRELRAGEFTPEALRAAIAELKAAVALDPGFVDAWGVLAQLQVEAFRLGGMRVADATEAERTLRRALALSPSSAEVRAASGRYHQLVSGDFVRSHQEYREALRLAPNRSDLLSGVGAAEMELGRWEEAVADLEHAARLDPRSPDAAGTLARAYLSLGRYPEARREIARARALRPTSLSLAYSQARIAAAEGDFDGVRRVLRQIEPSAGARAVVAYAALREDLIWALEDDQLRLLTSLTPEDLDGGRGDWALAVAQAHRLLGDSARSRAYADSAVIAYTAMLAQWGDRVDRTQVVATRALALALAGRTGEALVEGDSAIARQPASSGMRSPYVDYVRARIDVLAGRRERAVERLREMLTRPTRFSRGWIRIDRMLADLREEPGFAALVQ
jgi:TolB-like protein/thioredoxin-like negative regulator of GroEL